MRRFILLFIFFFAIGKVSTAEPQRLSERELIPILADLHVLEAVATMQEEKPKTEREALFNVYAPALYEKHGTNQIIFQQSLFYYMQYPATMDGIYKMVLEVLRANKRALQGIRRYE